MLRPLKDATTFLQEDEQSLVKRASFQRLLGSLARLGIMAIDGFGIGKEIPSGISFVRPADGVAPHPFRVTAQPALPNVTVRVGIGCVLWPGSPGPVFPTVNGVALDDPDVGALSGPVSRFVCVKFRMKPVVDTMDFTTGLTAPWPTSITYKDLTYDTATEGTPSIVLAAAGAAAPADLDFATGSTDYGDYLVPIAWIDAQGMATQLAFQSLAVRLTGLALDVTFF